MSPPDPEQEVTSEIMASSGGGERKPITNIVIIIAMQTEALPLVKRFQLQEDPDSVLPAGVPWVRYHGLYKKLHLNILWPGKDPTLESLNEHQSLLVESVINRSEVNAVAEKKQKMLELEEKHQKELEMELQRASARASSTEERPTEDEDAINELQQADIEIDEEDEEILSLDYWVDLNNQTKDTSSSRSSNSGSSKSSWGGDSEFSYTTDELPCPWRNRIGGVVKKWGNDSDGDKKKANVGENDRGRGSIEETIGPEMGSETSSSFY